MPQANKMASGDLKTWQRQVLANVNLQVGWVAAARRVSPTTGRPGGQAAGVDEEPALGQFPCIR